MTTERLRRLLPARMVPTQQQLLQTPGAKRLERWFSDPQYWITTRRSTSHAVAIGFFWTWLPVPGVTLIAALSACLFRANIPVSAALVWLNNPLTIAPLTWFSYLTGTRLLGPAHTGPALGQDWQFSSEWIATTLVTIWKPLALGAISLAIASAIAGYVATQLCWRIRQLWRRRRHILN